MHSSPASCSNPFPRRKAPIATLAALCALALPAALVPATATAMDDNGGAGECRSVPWAPPGAGWNGTEFCTLTDGSAGGGGGGGASGGDGSGTVGEVIVIVDPYSPPQPTNPLCKSARLCLPGQSGGGRPLGYSDDGRNPREPKGRGSGPAPKKPEAPKGKATQKECLELAKAGLIGIPADRVSELIKRREDVLEILMYSIYARRIKLETLASNEHDLDGPYKDSHQVAVFLDGAGFGHVLDGKSLRAQIQFLEKKFSSLKQELDTIRESQRKWKETCANALKGK